MNIRGVRIGITGATGYIGQALLAEAVKLGADVVAFSRHPPNDIEVRHVLYDIAKNENYIDLNFIDFIIHLAANTKQSEIPDLLIEELAADKLIEAAKLSGSKLIYVSSQSANPNARSSYGLAKWHIEKKIISAGGYVVRPGLVYGGKKQGLYGELITLIEQFPILPIFLPPKYVQPIHIVDLITGLLRLVEMKELPAGVYNLGSIEPVSFSEFIKNLSYTRLRLTRLFIPVPVFLLKFIGAFLPTNSLLQKQYIRLNSLFSLPIMETRSDLNKLNLIIRPYWSGNHASGNIRRRFLLREGKMFLSYISKDKPSSLMLRLYVRSIESLSKAKFLVLPSIFIYFPVLLSIVELESWRNNNLAEEFSFRMDIALKIAETGQQGARRFIEFSSMNKFFQCIFTISISLLNEAFWRSLKFLFKPLVFIGLLQARDLI